MFVCLTFSFEMIVALWEVAKIVERSRVHFTQFSPIGNISRNQSRAGEPVK